MMNLTEYILQSAEKHPEKVALRYKERKHTYAELLHAVNQVNAFFSHHTKKQEVVSLYMENSDEWIISYLGLIKAGCLCNPIGLRTSEENIRYQLAFAKPRFLVVSEKMREKCLRLGLDKKVKLISFEEIRAPVQQEGREGAYSTLMYTSGTTGSQKAIRLPHHVVVQATKNIQEFLNIRYDDIYYNILPLSHSFGIGNVHVTLSQGGTVIVAENTINIKKVLEDVVLHRATFLAAVPLTLKQMFSSFLPLGKQAGESLRTICTNTGPMPPETTKTILQHLTKTQFFTYYGLTEASRSSFQCFNLYPEKLTSVGKASPNVKISMRDEKGEELNPGEVGEICIQGGHCVQEYWNNEKASSESFKEGWFYTKDVGYLDEEGFLFVLGRKDDVVNLAGEKVSLNEIDEMIMSSELVKDAACIAIEDERTEFKLVALLAGKGNADLEQALKTFLMERLDTFKVPTEFVWVEQIPRTDSGKIKRKMIGEQWNS